MSKVKPCNMHIPLLSENVFHIEKIKNEKRVCPKRKIKGQKRIKKKVQRKSEKYGPKKKRDHESVQV